MKKTQSEKLSGVKNILETKKMSVYRSGEKAIRDLKNSGANEESIENKRKTADKEVEEIDEYIELISQLYRKVKHTGEIRFDS